MLSFKEFLTEAKKKPMVYLDMDGVLCDFFAAWWEFHKKNAKKMYAAESWEDLKKIPKNVRDKELETLPNAEEFFATLKPLPGGKKIVHFLRDNDIPFQILSTPLGSDREGSISGKTKWLEAHGLGNVKANFEENKAKYAKKGDILVDDYGVNIAKWNLAGGVGIKHDEDTTDNTLELLAKYLLGK